MATRPNTALDPLADKLRQVHTIPALVQYLHDELDWPVNVDDWEDNLFDWEPDELNLKAEHEVKIKSIKQLRPLVSGQPWGIFFVEFNKGRLPITALRRVLNGLVPKGRATGGGHQTWAVHDLLFVSSFGESNAREIALAHFTDESAQGDLPTLRVLGWDDDDTPMQLGYVAQTLRDKLRWPANTHTADDLAKWRAQWSSAFSLGHGQVINDSKTLALAMAELAKRIRRRVNTVLALESDSGHLRQMHKAFKDNLIADLSDDAFADMFAQTITYGLFTARASRSSGALVADNLSDMVPSTNPFLKELLGSFLSAAGRSRSSAKRVDFDELGINEVVTTLRDVPMDAVLRSFNATKPGDDPVIHFYEDFLKAYDKAMRAKRGVFYTPSPVVQFIVRSVDEILKTEFGIEDGLASTITWGEMMARKPELTLPKFCTTATPFVQVLDPATGTGTFIVEVITQIHAHMLAKWRTQGKVTKAQWQPLWVDYVKHHLLPRLYAFELMMAPYAIAHMKIGLKLAETGYTFPENGPRVNVFLTNALEPGHQIQPQLEAMAPMLAHEAASANEVKEKLAATVLLGNPPYSEKSFNQNPFIETLMDRYKLTIRNEEAQIKSVSNDYVKFIRFAQHEIQKSGTGVLGLITANGYTDGRLFRDMRKSLLEQFSKVAILDLLGSGRRGDATDLDENVFDILQGVAICVCSQSSGSNDMSGVAAGKLQGNRAFKFESLLCLDMADLVVTQPVVQAPLFLFATSSDEVDQSKLWPINEVVGRGQGHADRNFSFAGGFKTRQDSFTVAYDEKQLKRRIAELGDESLTEATLRSKYSLCSTVHFDFEAARAAAKSGKLSKSIRKLRYRPFDDRPMIWAREVLCEPQTSVTKYFDRPNLCLSTSRVVKDPDFRHVAIARGPVEVISLSGSTSTNAYMYPLWIYPSTSGFASFNSEIDDRIANIAPIFVSCVLDAIGCKSSDYRPEDPTAPLHAEKIFQYIYAVLHSPAYRQRYAAFLRTDFPRIPIPGSRKVFDALAKLGAELVAWHLLEHPDAVAIDASHTTPASTVTWFGSDFTLNKVAEKSRALAEVTVTDEKVGKVFINATSGFAHVHEPVWQHTIGGYQVLHKWLDDRRKAGRSLSQDDITHWLRVYASLETTQKLMLQVEVAIEANGGWPGAFSQNHPPPDAATLAAEQMVQKEQLKAQKKAATATKKRAVQASPTGATSLFDDLEDMARAAGGPDRPKSRATPAKAAGGKASGSAEQGKGLNDGQLMCAIRRVLTGAGIGGLSRNDLIRSIARELGHARTSPALKNELDSAIRRAVRRGIAENSGGVLTLLVKVIDGYDRDHLKGQLLAAMRAAGGSCAKADAPTLLARALGFARTGSGIAAVVESLLRGLVKTKQMESKAGQIRVLRAGAAV